MNLIKDIARYPSGLFIRSDDAAKLAEILGELTDILAERARLEKELDEKEREVDLLKDELEGKDSKLWEAQDESENKDRCGCCAYYDFEHKRCKDSGLERNPTYHCSTYILERME